MLELEGPKFFRLAFRVAAYDGVMTARLRKEREKQEEGLDAATQPGRLLQAGAEIKRVSAGKSYLDASLMSE